MVLPLMLTHKHRNAIKDRLQDAYGPRLDHVLLFGSEARGEAEEDSDIDVLVVLHGDVDRWREISRCVDALYPLELEIGRHVHAIPVSKVQFERQEYTLHIWAREEGVPL